MKIYIGTSGWSYPTGPNKWKGVFYPKGKIDELTYFSERFNTVEINVTFYRLIPDTFSNSWVKKTPKDFKFSVKLFQKFTHPKMFEDMTGKSGEIVKKDVDIFKKSLDPFIKAKKFATLLVQFPYRFHADEAGLETLGDILHEFKEYPKTVEFRHPSFLGSDEAYRMLEDSKTPWVNVDDPFGRFHRFCPFGDYQYLRLHGHNKKDWYSKAKDADRDARYDYYYTPEEIKKVSQEILNLPDKTKAVYVYFNNHPSAKAAANALMLKNELGEKITEEYNPEFLNKFKDLKKITN
ncbi:DUF72 domain-containing protein [Patescibacteria group bacterium]|nr:DUF72 domain-containing protein [Patescibacteria group bacterium]MBU1673056.1 DUF72 domain-containing protein [Patescibacteria group bacterium]MBU1963662.1 DUF72 domain-containing protein [Patescibacteria group bacterium]